VSVTTAESSPDALRALRSRASLAASAEERARCLADIERALARATGPAESAHLLMCRSHLHANQWETRKVVADALAAMQLFEEAGEVDGALDAASACAAYAARLGDLSLASELATKCIVGLSLLTDDALRSEVTNRLGMFCLWFHDYDLAIEQFEVSLSAAERCGNQRFVCRELYNLASTLLLAVYLDPGPKQGDDQRTSSRTARLAYAERTIRRLAAGSNSELVAWAGTHRLQAHLVYEQGHAEEAFQMLREAHADLPTEVWEEGKYDFDLLEARCLRALGRPAEAIAAAKRATEAVKLGGDEQEITVALRELVAAEQEAGQLEAALAHAVELSQRMSAVHRDQIAQVVKQVWVRAATELERSRLEVQTAAAIQFAEEDALTRVGNRRLLERFLAGPANDYHDLAFLMVDIDHFKQINDTFGHEVGDHVLRALGQLLATEPRAGQIVVRYGGEEFVLALPSVELGAARNFAERIRLKIESYPWETLALMLRVTVSIGVSCGPVASWQSVLAAADRGLYVAKRRGRNQVRTSR